MWRWGGTRTPWPRRAGLDLAESLQHTYLIAGLAPNAGEACVHLGRLDEAEQYALRSLRTEEEAHHPYAVRVLGLMQQQRGQPAQAERTLRSAIETAAWQSLAHVLGAASAADEARQAAEQLRAQMELPTQTHEHLSG